MIDETLPDPEAQVNPAISRAEMLEEAGRSFQKIREENREVNATSGRVALKFRELVLRAWGGDPVAPLVPIAWGLRPIEEDGLVVPVDQDVQAARALGGVMITITGILFRANPQERATEVGAWVHRVLGVGNSPARLSEALSQEVDR